MVYPCHSQRMRESRLMWDFKRVWILGSSPRMTEYSVSEQRPEALTMNYWYVIINPRYLTTEHKEKITMKKFLISATLGLFAFLPVFVSAHLVKE